MPKELTIHKPIKVHAYGVHEAKQLGLIDTSQRAGSYAILVETSRNRLTIYRPRTVVLEFDKEEESENEPAKTL